MIEIFLSQFWVQRLGWTLLHFLWQGTVIAVLYAMLRSLLARSLSARGRYVLACLALIVMAIAPPLTFLLLSGWVDNLPVIPLSISASAWQGFLPGFVAFWLAGVLTFSVRLFGGWRFTTRLRSTAHPAPHEWQQTLERIATRVGSVCSVRLLVSSLVDVPTVVGWLQPVILVPLEALTGLPPEYLTALLAHEMAHLRRHDYLASVLQSLAEAVLFYHPAVWWISDQIRAERESCCDDLAVAASGDVRTYVRALADLESRQAPRPKPALAANGGSLVNRIRRLIEPAQPAAGNLPGAGAAWAMALMWMAGVGVATVHATPSPTLNVHPLAVALPAAISSPRTSPFPSLPGPATALASHARDTLLFDPFLSAQMAQAAQPQSRQSTAGAGDDDKLLGSPWHKWLNEDVAYIITPEERAAFLQLNTDDQRQEFTDRFWSRRDPTPGTAENEYKQEHYRRIAYANQHFGSTTPGWKTDRGRVYITLGPPDEIESHSAGVQPYPMEVWRYRSAGAQGDNVIQFADTTTMGEFRIVQGQPGIAQSASEFERMQQFFGMQTAPQLQFPDLAATAGDRSAANRLPMMVRMHYLRGTGSSTIVNITVQFEDRDLQFQSQNGVDKAAVNLFGRVTSMTRRPVTTFEPTVKIDVPAGQPHERLRQLYQQSVPLAPGRYILEIVAKDIGSGNTTNYRSALDVPHFFAEDGLAISSLILADTIEKIPTKPLDGAVFAIGDSRIRPRVGEKFAPGEKMGIYLQVYNFAPDDKTHRPAGSIGYEIDKAGSEAGSNDKVMGFSEEVGSIPDASATQVTIQKLLPLATFAPGSYMLRITVTDRVGNQTVQQQEKFTVSAE